MAERLGRTISIAIVAGLIGGLLSLVLFLILDEDSPARGGVFLYAGLDKDQLSEEPFCDTRNGLCLTVDNSGEIIAVYPFETNSYHRQLGCDAEWRGDMRFTDPGTGLSSEGWFRGRCGGSTYDRHGNRVFGPSARDLDRFPVSLTEDGIEVDTRHLICGEVMVTGEVSATERECALAPPPA